MKTILKSFILISMAWSQSASAADCYLDTKEAVVSYYKGETDLAREVLLKKGYGIGTAPKGTLQFALTIEKEQDSFAGCSRTMKISQGQASGEVVYEKTSDKMGFKYHKTSDPCPTVFEKAINALPTCEQILTKIAKTQKDGATQVSSGPSYLPASSASGAQ